MRKRQQRRRRCDAFYSSPFGALAPFCRISLFFRLSAAGVAFQHHILPSQQYVIRVPLRQCACSLWNAHRPGYRTLVFYLRAGRDRQLAGTVQWRHIQRVWNICGRGGRLGGGCATAAVAGSPLAVRAPGAANAAFARQRARSTILRGADALLFLRCGARMRALHSRCGACYSTVLLRSPLPSLLGTILVILPFRCGCRCSSPSRCASALHHLGGTFCWLPPIAFIQHTNERRADGRTRMTARGICGNAELKTTARMRLVSPYSFVAPSRARAGVATAGLLYACGETAYLCWQNALGSRLSCCLFQKHVYVQHIPSPTHLRVRRGRHHRRGHTSLPSARCSKGGMRVRGVTPTPSSLLLLPFFLVTAWHGGQLGRRWRFVKQVDVPAPETALIWASGAAARLRQATNRASRLRAAVLCCSAGANWRRRSCFCGARCKNACLLPALLFFLRV